MGSVPDHTSELVLITGATGHLGFKTLLDALEAGYQVRAAVRSDSKAKVITSNAAFKAANIPEGQLNFVIVPDLAVPGAYDEAVKDVKYVIHIASPITTGGKLTQAQFKEYFIKPAVQGTVGMLESAAKSPSVRRVVITSSVVALVPFEKIIGGSEDHTYTAEDRIPFSDGPYAVEFQAYSASKTAALNEAEAWMAKTKPHFDLVHIHPSYVEGRDELVRTKEEAMAGTNGIILRAVTGVKAPFSLAGTTVHNDDVARLHVDALLVDKIPAGSYIANSDTPDGKGTQWETVNEIVSRNFPEAIKEGLFSNDGSLSSVHLKISNEKTEKTFGWKFQGFEAQVKSVVGMYIDVAAKA
jgi:nucleoside-diphosphate-sugar epimerase